MSGVRSTDLAKYAGVSRVVALVTKRDGNTGDVRVPEGAQASYACAECFELIDRLFGVSRGDSDSCDFCFKSVGYQCRLVRSTDLLRLEAALAAKEQRDE